MIVEYSRSYDMLCNMTYCNGVSYDIMFAWCASLSRRLLLRLAVGLI